MNDRYVTKTGFVAEPGAVIDGRYELRERIGVGGTATVWSAMHTLGRFPCVVKFMNRTRGAYELGLDEFRLLSNVYHPNIVRTFAIGVLEGHDHIYISMELLDGTTLIPYVEKKLKPDPSKVLGWLQELVSVLAYIHGPELRIIHKDIKPANIMVGPAGSKLIDFNISEAGSFQQGTAPYKCPSVESDMRWTNFADLWALAVTFYEVLTQHELFQEKTTFDVGLDRACPPGFPPRTFEALKAVILGRGRDVEDPARYHELFATDEHSKRWTEIPEAIATTFNITSRNQHFLTLGMMNQPDPRSLRSKSALSREALHGAGLPAGAETVKKLRAVYSQLKSRGVVEYGHKADRSARLTEEFFDALEATAPPR